MGVSSNIAWFVPIVILLLQGYYIQPVISDVPTKVGEGRCIWYDTCAPNPDKVGHLLNCKYDGEAKPLRHPIGREVFKATCPELFDEITEEYSQLVTCCSKEQIYITAAQIAPLLTLINNCPACKSNLRKNFCYFACHPRHSAFLIPTELYFDDSYDVSIWTVAQYQSLEYINNAYNSCENVYFAPLNGPALDTLCGPWGSEQCTPERLFNYFGNNFLAPFNITYVYTDDNEYAPDVEDDSVMHEMQPFNVETFPCNTTDPDMRCRCEDCEESCVPPPKPPSPPEHTMVGEIRLYVFLIIIIYSVFVVVFLVLGCWRDLPGNSEEEMRCFSCNQKLSAEVEKILETSFRKFGECVTYHPFIVLASGCVVIIALSVGIINIKMTTNPVELWASPESRTRLEKQYYDNNFGPFYRTNQIIITSVGIEPFNVTYDRLLGQVTYEFGPVFDSKFMLEVMDMQLQIMNLTAEFDGKVVTLNDVCIKPMAPTNNECLIESVLNYWQNDLDELEDMMFDSNGTETFEYTEHLLKCLSNPNFIEESENCMGSYGGPIFPYVALGGFLEAGQTLTDDPRYERSTALVLTFLGQNYVNEEDLGPSLAWEKKYLDFIKSYSNPMMDIAFYSERSLEDEIKRQSKGDISTILISYIVMFVYVSISLGNLSSDCRRLCIESKITLGLASVILVFLSVAASLGLCAYIGVEGTLFVIEVIPFLVLAVGVDNIFLLVQTLQREKRLNDETVEQQVARVVGKVAPSMLLASSSEAICFFLGALSKMPAVHAFSIYAGFALTIDFLLQITCLVALIVLDAKRTEANRYDIFCCIKGEKKKSDENQEVCLSFFENFYAPFLMKDPVRKVVVVVFVGAFCTSCIFVPKMDVGLEQNIGMPDDSYVLKYFDYLGNYLSVGSPIYFVIKDGFNFPNITEQNLICQSKGCNEDSILAKLFMASKYPNMTYIATGANSWLDGYFLWISDTGGSNEQTACCRLDDEGNFIDSSLPDDESAVETCLNPRKDFYEETERPLPEKFMEYLPEFLIDNPHGTNCPQAGHPSYGAGVVVKEEGCGNETSCVGANNFMTYHTILKVSREFTDALDKAYELTDYMNAYLRNYSMTPDVEIFPYSVFYVFYEQYLTMWNTTIKSLGISFLSLFVVMILLTGFDFRSTCINIIIIIMVTVDLMGIMVPWSIQLNAISLVNLVMAAGISVEFCSHISHAFAMTSSGSKVERVIKSLSYTGSSVLSGITLTKFGGIVVLAFANSQVFTIFYFRMYLLIVLLGAAHGLIFLPVLLSLIGPPSNPYIQRYGNKEEPVLLKYSDISKYN